MKRSNPAPDRIRLPIGATPVRALLRQTTLPENADALISTLREISDRLPSGWPVGLEQDLLRRRFGGLDLPIAEVRSPLVRDVRYLSHSTQHSQKLYRRPPSELAAKILWERAARGPLREADLLAAAESSGGAAGLRTGKMMTTPFPSGH